MCSSNAGAWHRSLPREIEPKRFFVGSDVGGTFTDLWVPADGGDTRVFKTPTTSDVLGGVIESVGLAAQSFDMSFERFCAGIHVVSKAGCILSTGDTRWRRGAIAHTYDQQPPEYRITLHAELALTAFYCPASGALLAIDVHRRGETTVDDLVLDLEALAAAPRDDKRAAVA